MNGNAPRFARAYARTLFRSALARNELDAVIADVRALDAQWRGSPELRLFCRSHQPGNTESHERQVSTLWGTTFTESLLVLLRALARREHLALIPPILEQFFILHDLEKGRTHVEASFAVEPTPALLNQVRDKILARRGGTVEMRVKIDPSLIAGFVITLNDQRIDASMAGRLNRLRLGLKKPGGGGRGEGGV